MKENIHGDGQLDGAQPGLTNHRPGRGYGKRHFEWAEMSNVESITYFKPFIRSPQV